MPADKKNKNDPPVVPYATTYADAASPARWDLNVVLTWLFCGFLLLIPLAEVLLYFCSTLAAGLEMTHDRSRFAVANALTLTGFQGAMSVSSYPLPGRIVILCLTLIGALFPMIVGGLAGARILRLRCSDRQIVYSALAACGILVIVGAIPLIEARGSLLEAFMLSASAFGNGGLFFGRDLPATASWQTQLVLMPLAILGGLGLPVLMELAGVLRGKLSLSTHSRTVLFMTAALYLVGFGLILLMRWLTAEGSADGARAVSKLITSSSVQAINSRTAGFAFEWIQDVPRGVQWILIPLMMIGGSPAGTAGGLKTTTLAQLFRGGRGLLRGEAGEPATGFAIAWVGLYVAFIGLFFLPLLWLEPQGSSTRLLFDTISALSNVGLSFDRVYMVTPSLDVLSAAMVVGRLAPLAMLWWMAHRNHTSELLVA